MDIEWKINKIIERYNNLSKEEKARIERDYNLFNTSFYNE